MSTILLDPTSEVESAERPRLPRPTALDGLTVGVLDISKPRGDVFLDRLSDLLADRGFKVERYRKPTVIRPAPVELQQQIAAECDVVVEGLAD